MDTTSQSAATPAKNPTKLERKSERETVVTRTFNGPKHIVWEAWTNAELFKQWWSPKSFGLNLVSCEVDARTGGTYRLVFVHGDSPPRAFHGRYLEATPPSRLVWTNEEADEGGSITTLTLEEVGDKTLVVLHELYPSKEALDEAIASGATSGTDETFEQLDAMLVTMVAAPRS